MKCDICNQEVYRFYYEILDKNVCNKCMQEKYKRTIPVLEQIAKKQPTLSDNIKAWDKAIEKQGFVN